MRDEENPGAVMRFVRWRRAHGGWAYGCLVGGWALITFALVDLLSWSWHAYAISAALFVLLFEVGIAYMASAAWASHRQLEYEGEVISEDGASDR